MFRILVVEDDKIANRIMCATLRSNGYEAIAAFDGEDALEKLDHEHIDLMITDLMMPNMNGYELTDTLRESGETLPILMVTAKDQQQDKHRGFLVGTDDYMTKPVDNTEMLYRIKALLRRAKIVEEKKIEIGKVTLHYNSLTVTRENDTQELPPKEFYLLYKLLAYPGQVFTRLQLLDEIWGLDSESDAGTVNVHISRLRKRFENYPEFDLVSVRGLGYKAVKHCE